MKNTLSCSQSNPQNGENRILGLFLGKHVPRPPEPPPIKKGPNAPLLMLSVTLFKPASYLNYY